MFKKSSQLLTRGSFFFYQGTYSLCEIKLTITVVETRQIVTLYTVSQVFDLLGSFLFQISLEKKKFCKVICHFISYSLKNINWQSLDQFRSFVGHIFNVHTSSWTCNDDWSIVFSVIETTQMLILLIT